MIVYGNYDQGYGSIWSSIKSAAGAIVPKHTIVGKLLSGNVGGAASATVKLIARKETPTAAAESSSESFAPKAVDGAFPKWVLPVGAGAGILLLLLFLKKGRKRGRR